MIKIAVVWILQLKRAEANVVERLVVDAESLVGIFDELMNGERRVVRLDDLKNEWRCISMRRRAATNRVRDFGRRQNGKRAHDAIRILFADLRDKQRAHAGSRAAAKRVRQLKALKAVAALRFFAHNIEHVVDELGALGVVPFCPIIAGAALSCNLRHFS